MSMMENPQPVLLRIMASVSRSPVLGNSSRRRMKAEAKAKVVAANWETQNVFNSLSRWLFCLGRFEEQDELYQDDIYKRMSSS